MLDVRRVAQDFSAAAPYYDPQTALQKHALSELAGEMLPLLAPKARLLDAGCGTGRFARLYGGYPVTQFDIAYMMCRVAATPDAPAVTGTMQSLPFKDGVFDGVFCCLALQWVPDVESAMKELQRVLKPGGVLAVGTFGPATLKELRESFAAIDPYPHVLTFAAPGGYDKSEVVTEYYPDLFALMSHLKAIGARNKLLDRRKSLTTRAQMVRVEQRYQERFATPSGLPVTWEILYSVERKP